MRAVCAAGACAHHGVFCRCDGLAQRRALLDLVLLPAVVLVLLAGAGGGAVGWLLLLLGCVGAWAAARSVRRRRLWGKKDSTVYTANVENFLTTQKTTAAGMMLVCAVLFLPALALRPVLALPLDALQPVTERARAAALGAAIEWLPKISGGALNFHVSAAAGGVEDGSLTQSDGPGPARAGGFTRHDRREADGDGLPARVYRRGIRWA